MKKITKELAWFLGVLGGDGNLQKYFLAISDQSLENLRVVKHICKNLNVKCKITRDRSERRFKLWVFSAKLMRQLHDEFSLPIGRKDKLQIPKIIRKGSRGIRNCYIAGWFDAEGHIELWKQPKTGRVYKRVNLCCKNKNVISWVKNQLKLLGINCYSRFSDKVWRIQMCSKQSVEKFIKNIKLMYPAKRNRLLLSRVKG